MSVGFTILVVGLSIVAELSRALPRVVSPAGLMLYGPGVLAVSIGLKKAWNWYSSTVDSEHQVNFSRFIDEPAQEERGREQPVPDDLGELQQNTVAPTAIKWETRSALVGEQWTTTMSIVDYPDYPSDGYLSDLFEMTDVEFDLTVHLNPKNRQKARRELQDAADDLQVDADLEQSVRGAYLQERADEVSATYKAVEGGQNVFDQGMFVTVRADTKAELRESARKVRRALRDDPANLTPKTAICKQDLALQSAAPIGPNVFGRESIALGGAVGALLASPNTPNIIEEGGVEFGIHKDTRSPVVIDPFARENGYAMFTVGDPGSGKSFGAKQNFIRSIEQSQDRIGIVLEPLNNWTGVSEALGAERITIGGTLGLNPLEIKPTSDRVQRSMGEDASPFKEKLDDAMSFLTNYFALRGVELGDRRTTLEVALENAYERNGITEDIGTHSNDSPTIRDVMDVLQDMIDDPETFVVRSTAEAEKIREDAKWLIDQLRPFEEGGRYANLGKPTEFDIRDEKTIYLDLGQQEGSVGGSTSLLMQLLISLVYERAKETDKEVVFVIDEARYIMQDASNLSFLETVFRHHRHHDLSIRLVTQTVDEFFQHAESEAILDQCAIKQFHRLDGMDEDWAEEFGLNYAQMRYVQDAVPGSEQAGFSEALVGVDGEWRGIEVQAMDKEQQVIDFNPREQSSTDLPGTNGSQEELKAFKEQLNQSTSPSGQAFPGGASPAETDGGIDIEDSEGQGQDSTSSDSGSARESVEDENGGRES
ncbi:VirB4 family type IV secretion system protein [Halorussus salinisoli]|uniref:VirB4 family type IV secretion system protein n=1 Tax=Halorussus salinisoli TaxID=2558242 RepID=UPI002A91B14B|nr:transferase [Halorussus salinisoli]